MPNRDVSEPFIEQHHVDPTAGNTGDQRPADSSNRDGYDEAQRAEIAEFEGSGRTDDIGMTDMDPDMGGSLDDDEVEDLEDGLDQIIDTDAPFREE